MGMSLFRGHRGTQVLGTLTWRLPIFPSQPYPTPSHLLEEAIRTPESGNCLEARGTLRRAVGSVRLPDSFPSGLHRGDNSVGTGSLLERKKLRLEQSQEVASTPAVWGEAWTAAQEARPRARAPSPYTII